MTELKDKIMQSDEQHEHKNRKPSRSRTNWEFYYLERVGSRYYLRFTWFGLAFVIIVTLIFFAALILSGR